VADSPPGVGATGLGVAAIRAAETNRPDRLFADPLAAAFVAAANWTTPDRPPEDRVRALTRWVVARTVFLDGLLTDAGQAGCHQAVLLGAGFDTRAFRLPWPPGARLFELDSADVLDGKARVLAQQAAQPACHRVPVPCDLREDWPGALLAAGFTPARPTVWIAEGLLVYLDWEEVQGLIADLSELSAPGSRLGLSLATRSPAGTGWLDSLRRSTAPEDPAHWLAGHGWTAGITDPADVLAAHGRTPTPTTDRGPASDRGPTPDRGPAATADRAAHQPSRPRALLVAATR
jgi:methyltransferase (TIGR00027 family)